LSSEPSILLVEDHLAIRKGLEVLLRGAGFPVIGVTESAEQAYGMFVARRPDVAVVDVALRDGSGLELTERILEEDPDAGVLVYTGMLDPASVEKAAQTGARGLALKTVSPSELMHAIRAVAEGGVHVDPTVAALLAPSKRAQPHLLSAREREILDLLAAGKTGEEAARDLFLSPETVRTHVRNAMRKLDANTRVHAVALAVRQREISL
jgi:DNA-binding NarL/FixJ family response regulator